ncbi:MAG: hypothetical protein MUO72_18210 [Bacteroidales bacterium]|nr:hypothetical protein [Bacteroidales bacterium]
MKKYFFILVILLTVFACKKVKFSPEGPTDVRVRNLSDLTFYEVIVNTSGGIDTLGDIGPGNESEYYRFDKAYPKAEISATINSEKFYTGPVNYTYMQYLGQDKITYEVDISSMSNKTLTIFNVIHEEPINP